MSLISCSRYCHNTTNSTEVKPWLLLNPPPPEPTIAYAFPLIFWAFFFVSKFFWFYPPPPPHRTYPPCISDSSVTRLQLRLLWESVGMVLWNVVYNVVWNDGDHICLGGRGRVENNKMQQHRIPSPWGEGGILCVKLLYDPKKWLNISINRR